MSGTKNKIELTYEESHKVVDGVLFKLCSNPECKIKWYPCVEEYFYKNSKNGKDGLNPKCKICAKESSKIRQSGKKEENAEYWKDYYEKNKKEYNDKRRIKRRNNEEMDIKDRRKREKIWIQQHPNKLKVYNEKYSNKKHKITDEEWENCKKYFNHRCAYCGLPIEEHYYTRNGVTNLGDFHKEHVNHEGASDLSNCVPSCKSCNCKKHEFNMEEWYEQQEFYDIKRLNKIHKWINEDCFKYIEEKKFRKLYTRKSKNEENLELISYCQLNSNMLQ